MCGKEGTHMHEGLLSRAAVRGRKLQKYIMVRYNCVIVCAKCHVYAHTKEGRVIAARYLIEREGKKNIERWAKDLSKKAKLDWALRTVKFYLQEAIK